MLVCTIMIKRKHQNSVLYNLSVTKVMAFFGVSFKKAKKLMQAMKESDMFIYNEKKNALYAKPLKSGNWFYYKKGKTEYKAFADYCRKMQMQDDISLRQVVRELRNILLLNAVSAVERKSGDNLIKVCLDSNHVTKPPKSAVIPQRKLGTAIGMSRATAGRYMNQLIKDGRVGKTLIVAECVIGCLNEDTEHDWREKHPNKQFFTWHSEEHGGWSAWRLYGYAYAITDRKDSEAFQHVIYNYDRSGRDNQIQPRNSGEIDGRFKC